MTGDGVCAMLIALPAISLNQSLAKYRGVRSGGFPLNAVYAAILAATLYGRSRKGLIRKYLATDAGSDSESALSANAHHEQSVCADTNSAR